MAAKDLSGRVGPGLDPCGAIRVPFELLDGADARNRLSSGRRNFDAEMRSRSRGASVERAVAHEVLEDVRQYWQHTSAPYKWRRPIHR